MKFNEFEIRIFDWVRVNICGAFPDKSLQRVIAEAAVILKARQIEEKINSLRPMLQEAGLLDKTGEVQLNTLRQVIIPALKNAGGLEFSIMGKKFSIEEADFNSIFGS